MNKITKIVFAVSAALSLTFSAGCSKETPFMGNTVEATLEENDVFAVLKIKDYEEEITIKLFPQVAPLAVKKFIETTNLGFYDNRIIHRVVKDKLIQGGSLSGTGYDGDVSDKEYFGTETNRYMNHYYGAVCMAKNSKGNYRQFYIVNSSEPVNIDEIAAKLKEDLDNEEIVSGLLPEDKKYYQDYYTKLNSIPAEVKERYQQVGGIYEYDGEDTVFGQVVDGWNTLKAINEAETAFGNDFDDSNGIASKPITDIIIESVEIIRITPEETTTEEKTRATRATRESTAAETTTVPETQNTQNTEETQNTDQTLDTTETPTPSDSAA